MMQFRQLADYFERLEKVSSRLEMTRILAEMFRVASDEEVDKICYLSLGRLVPAYESLEFNLADKMVIRAIALALNVDKTVVARELKQKGDVGLVVQELKIPAFTKATAGRQNAKLTVLEVYGKLRKIAEDSGEGSQERKVNGLAELVKSLDAVSGKYVVRMVVGKLRLGFSDKTMIDALSWMKVGDKSLRDALEAAYFVRADIGELASAVKKRKSIKSITPILGVPVMPALCQRLKTAEEMIAKMGKVAVEPKFDGTRVQIHIAKSEKLKAKNNGVFLRTFTRNLEESTAMFPELKLAYKKVKAKEVILDGEAVGVNPKTGRWLSFQETIVRKRKHDVVEVSRRVPLKFFMFDVLYKDGESLLGEPLYKRREILEKVVDEKGVLQITEQVVTDKVKKLREYHSEQLRRGLEGVVVKQWQGRYEPGRRGFNWVKFKEEEKSRGGLVDTLDCVVMGYYRGKGKRAGLGIGAFLVGVRKGEQFLTVSKIGTGLSDEQWREIKVTSDKRQVTSKPKEYVVDKSLVPDVWVVPAIVVEIAADNITRSPNHSAQVALRFPRLVRFREDKSPNQVTSLREVKAMMS
ncbi:MAG: ATP-dependent DNA ligase [Candidatus Chisholmbacteria bacterium]|nr:ATP-dependent DNA ligase [Candidatus Chisholmbacteria bacterium]